MIIAGITGGIGSGKSTVCAVFELLGVPVYYADEESKRLFHEPSVADMVLEKFGKAILKDGVIDRKLLGSIVFNDPQKLLMLNEIMHPAVKEHFNKWCALHRDSAYVLKEAAILFESDSYKSVQKIITVTAPVELRIARVIKRDQALREDVMKRIASQISDEEKIKRSDFVLVNDEKELLIPEIIKIHQELKQEII
ncbi:MAG: dephospho-CoA kinase [Bacteroidetes bacterium]|jgi:dephospho-CoA kinase|nr:dephospho-CoA kinase [Bacteroidota bacterium]